MSWLAKIRNAWDRWRRPAFIGATVGYARELHAMITDPGWLSPEEQASAARLAAAAEQTAQDLETLRGIEYRTQQSLDALWAWAERTLTDPETPGHLDDIDIEWAILASGELTTV